MQLFIYSNVPIDISTSIRLSFTIRLSFNLSLESIDAIDRYTFKW